MIAAIHSTFITPTTNSNAISTQQQPTHRHHLPQLPSVITIPEVPTTITVPPGLR